MRVPFNIPYAVGEEIDHIRDAILSGHLSGNGPYAKRCERWIRETLDARFALLTHSCTGALEMAALLCDLGPGDEVVMPSFTFVSTANAVVLRGATPVFVDIQPDTLNIDPEAVAAAITPRTRAIFVVHYAGVACEMDAIMEIARQHDLIVVEDAAQGVQSRYRGRALGTIGHLGAFSFHETKSLVAGEGGALVVNDDRFRARAEILQEKGTNRSAFFRGETDKYTWQDVGSSFLMNEMTAAYLWAQLAHCESILTQRAAIWDAYHADFADLEVAGFARRPVVPAHCTTNSHIYYLIAQSPRDRDRMLDALKAGRVQATFHYVPLHSAPAGRRYGRVHGDLSVTDEMSARLLRLPIWAGMTPAMIEHVRHTVRTAAAAVTAAVS